jgi:2-polyprenyl-3-methyl-5-hydroxy-6-metoxy-1,4-benzoquinol methylase
MWFKILANHEQLSKAYTGQYGQEDAEEGYFLGESARELFRNILGEIEMPSAASTPRLLDIGAGQGAFLEEAQKLGYEAEGVDLSEANVQKARARGLQVKYGSAEKLNYDRVFDVVTMLDIIEHVPDPLHLLAIAYHALKPQGELVVYTPNHRGAVVMLARFLQVLGISSPVYEIFGGNHVCFFDDRSLALAIKKAGFVERKTQLFPYDPRRPGQYISPVNLAAVTAVEWLGKPFNRVFRLLTYARRPS